MRLRIEMKLFVYTFLRVVKSFYGIPGSTLHWYWSYIDRHTTRLEVLSASMDWSPLLKPKERLLHVFLIFGVDRSLIIGSDFFL